MPCTAPYRRPEGAGDLMNLAARILDPDRPNTLVVLTADSKGRPHFDPFEIGDALAGTDVDVYLLSDPRDAGRLSTLTDRACSPYGGAAAVLEPGARQRIVLSEHDGSADYLIGAAMRHAMFTGRPAPSTAPAPDGDGEARELRAEIKRLRGEVRRLKAARTGADDDLAALFGPADDWLDLAVRIAWARIIPAGDKRDIRLPDRWTYARGFAAAVKGAPRRERIVEAVARILLGLDDRHPLREGSRGARNRLGDWGNIVWRTVAETGVPDAWRIHWTRDDRGDVVLLEAGGHDDHLEKRG
ncbi:hypothetical protein [Bifidobacterium myosotis]|uniref:Uncharacterized protein n=1 Tax=Bifidobacterium myosotis TaxID=1630166 RepID=A0A5M9ZHP6_9BIFI|nr:hypothetical protein [Bifidobacterium myosotis]KAA8826979.1 hypothetical protein EMO91_10635 [Bifidobacterium myosotis]